MATFQARLASRVSGRLDRGKQGCARLVPAEKIGSLLRRFTLLLATDCQTFALHVPEGANGLRYVAFTHTIPTTSSSV